jgi:FtsH-binding integral membrane protein
MSNLSKDKQTNRRRMPADHIGALLASLGLTTAGVLGLVAILNTRPNVVERWAFFLLLHFLVTGLAIPLVRYVNVRLTPSDGFAAPGGVIVRQSVWIGLFVVICAWLQMQRGLSVPIAFFISLVFAVLEGFLRTREISGDFDG